MNEEEVRLACFGLKQVLLKLKTGLAKSASRTDKIILDMTPSVESACDILVTLADICGGSSLARGTHNT